MSAPTARKEAGKFSEPLAVHRDHSPAAELPPTSERLEMVILGSSVPAQPRRIPRTAIGGSYIHRSCTTLHRNH